MDISDNEGLESTLALALEELKWRKLLDEKVTPEKWQMGHEAFRQLFRESLIHSPFRANEKFLLLGLEIDIVENDPWIIRLSP